MNVVRSQLLFDGRRLCLRDVDRFGTPSCNIERAESVMTHGSRSIETAFVKQPLSGAVTISTLGIEGDEHVYEHGGPDMALLIYPSEHYSYWRSVGLQLPDPAGNGRKLYDGWSVETDVAIEDFISVGSVVVQVAQPRSPCYVGGSLRP